MNVEYRKLSELKLHPITEIFPAISDGDLQALAADIKLNGVQVQLLINADNEILDGRSRYLACGRAGVDEVPVEIAPPGTDPLTMALSRNLKRRQLTKSQIALCAARLCNLGRGRRQLNVPNGTFDRTYKIEDVCRFFGVGRSSVMRAKFLLNRSDEALAKNIEEGTTTPSRAVTQIAERDTNSGDGDQTADTEKPKRKKRVRNDTAIATEKFIGDSCLALLNHDSGVKDGSITNAILSTVSKDSVLAIVCKPSVLVSTIKFAEQLGYRYLDQCVIKSQKVEISETVFVPDHYNLLLFHRGHALQRVTRKSSAVEISDASRILSLVSRRLEAIFKTSVAIVSKNGSEMIVRVNGTRGEDAVVCVDESIAIGGLDKEEEQIGSDNERSESLFREVDEEEPVDEDSASSQTTTHEDEEYDPEPFDDDSDDFEPVVPSRPKPRQLDLDDFVIANDER